MNYTESCSKLKNALENADAVVIGAGAGLSTSAGFTYSGKRFEENFADFIEKYGFRDMYSAGFYDYDTPEEMWAYWSRYIYINRYTDAPKDTYKTLLDLVKEKNSRKLNFRRFSFRKKSENGLKKNIKIKIKNNF